MWGRVFEDTAGFRAQSARIDALLDRGEGIVEVPAARYGAPTVPQSAVITPELLARGGWPPRDAMRPGVVREGRIGRPLRREPVQIPEPAPRTPAPSKPAPAPAPEPGGCANLPQHLSRDARMSAGVIAPTEGVASEVSGPTTPGVIANATTSGSDRDGIHERRSAAARDRIDG